MQEIVREEVVGFIPQIVFSEFYYRTWQKLGNQVARIQFVSLRESKLNEYILAEKDLYLVGETKVRNVFLSIVDSIDVATAKATKSTNISTDQDFGQVAGVKSTKLYF